MRHSQRKFIFLPPSEGSLSEWYHLPLDFPLSNPFEIRVMKKVPGYDTSAKTPLHEITFGGEASDGAKGLSMATAMISMYHEFDT